MKTIVKRILAGAVIVLVFFAPFLLLIDFAKFVPVVLTVWLLSAVYFVFIKSRR
ncbi:MAG: hypothetical protein MUC72_00265 [Acidobacteria bacterium]|nr:hypothetical protein [Acidobacteriota bacterium]